MPVTVTTTPAEPVPQIPPRKRWTRTECAAAERAGLWVGDHLELIEGELISKMGKNQPHVLAVARLMQRLVQAFGWDAVACEAPIGIAREDQSTSEPEPDLIVLRRPLGEFRSEQPQPADLLLVIEVADATLRFDLTTKAALYARAGIAEYWVLDLNARRLIVHQRAEDGQYQSIVAFSDQERVAPQASRTSEWLVSDLLG